MARCSEKGFVLHRTPPSPWVHPVVGHSSTVGNSMEVSLNMSPMQILVTLLHRMVSSITYIMCCSSVVGVLWVGYWQVLVGTRVIKTPRATLLSFLANQDLLCTMYSAEFSMITCFTQNLVKTSPCFLFYSAEFSRNVCFTPNLVKTSKFAKFSRILYFTRNLVKTSTW
jgi:hypothetical protein